MRALKTVLIVTLVLATAPGVFGQWPLYLVLPGETPAHYPIMCADGEGGVIIACAGLGWGYDLWLIRVSAEGEVLWSGEDTPRVRMRAPGEQFPIAVTRDEDGHTLVLMEDTDYESWRRMLLWCADAEGDSMWCVMIQDSRVDRYATVTTVAGRAVVIWSTDYPPDSTGRRFQRVDIDDGTLLDGTCGRRFTQTTSSSVAVAQDELVIVAGDSLYTLNPATGDIRAWDTALPFPYGSVAAVGDSVLVGGTDLQTSVVLLVCYVGDTMAWLDTVCADGGGGRVQPCPDGVSVLYERSPGMYVRFRTSAGLGPEIVIEDLPGIQRDYKLVVGDSAIVVAWYDSYREELWIQQVRNGQTRWPNGIALGPVQQDSPAWIDACEGGAYGFVVRGWHAALYLQPGDSLITGSTPPRSAATPIEFRLLPPYPNPCNGSVQLQFELPTPARVALTLFNVLGQEVLTAADGWYPAGIHQVTCKPPASGKYWVRLKHESHIVVASFIYLP